MKTFLKVWLSIGLIAIVFGIGILVIAAASGATWKDVPTYSLNESYDDVEKIDIEIGYGEVKIVEGDEFSIDAVNLLDEGLESYVSDGTWRIKESYDDDLSILGLRFSAKQMTRWNDDSIPHITITIPKDFVAESFNLKVSAGSVEVDTLKAGNGYFTIEAGNLEINQLSISGKSEYTVGTGRMILEQLEARDIQVECGVGDIVIEGTITGDNDITCGIGKVELLLNGEEDDYSYEVEAGLGNVEINNDSYHNMSNKMIRNDGAENNFTLDCGIGNIIVEFN